MWWCGRGVSSRSPTSPSSLVPVRTPHNTTPHNTTPHQIRREGRKRQELYAYEGVVVSVAPHTPVPRQTTAQKAAGRKRARGRGGRGKAQRAEAGEQAQAAYLPSAEVEWRMGGEHGERSRVFLVMDYYGRIDIKDGWIVHESTPKGPTAAMDESLEEKMHWDAVKAEML